MFRRLFPNKFAPPSRSSSVPPDRRIYAIGDIHGRLDLFDRLLGMIARDQRGRTEIEPEIILLGDLIDRGPHSAGVVRLAMYPRNGRFSALMGNHEAAMVEAMSGDLDMMDLWLKVGGQETLESWGVDKAIAREGTLEQVLEAAVTAVPRTALAWMAAMHQSIAIGDYFFVHAGVRPGVALDAQSRDDSFWIREDFLQSRRDHGAIIVHGHSITAEVEQMPNRIGLDTGAYDSGKLTALGLEGEERWFLQT